MTKHAGSEPTEAQVEAAAKALREMRDFDEGVSSTLLDSWSRMVATTALVAAQGAAPPVNNIGTSAEPVKNGDDSLHVEPRAESDCWHEANCSCPSVLPSSGVDEDALARLLCEKNYLSPDGKPTCAACRDKAHEVAAWLKVQGGESRGDR